MSAPEFTQRLLEWFDVHGRHHLPWQANTTPYRVWVSEVMLQQTQVATVMPYFERFMARFPSVQELAHAPLDEVLHLWTGLGYYARARNLHACAQAVAQSGGEFPTDLAAMTALPGIGRSTAGAILAITQHQRHPILDGNVKRVMARVFGVEGDPSGKETLARLWRHADACTPGQRVAAYTQAVMDLGATVCTRARPACTLCPMSTICSAALQGRQAQLPGAKLKRVRPSRETTLLIAETQVDGATCVLLERRPARGLWGGLWSPPQFSDASAALAWCEAHVGRTAGSSDELPAIHHAFTHFDLRMQPVRVRCDIGQRVEDDTHRWYSLAAPAKIGLPQPIKRLFERLRES